MFLLLCHSARNWMWLILISILTLLFQLICRECIIDKNARIGKNVVIANSEVWSSRTPTNSKRLNFYFNFILFLLGLTYFPLIHQFAGSTRSRQILRRILHSIRHNSHIEELNNFRWISDMNCSNDLSSFLSCSVDTESCEIKIWAEVKVSHSQLVHFQRVKFELQADAKNKSCLSHSWISIKQ